MTIKSGYRYPGIEVRVDDVLADISGIEQVEMLQSSPSEFTMCGHDSHYRQGGYVEILSAGGGIGELLDDSNGAALYAMANGWIDANMDADDAMPYGDSSNDLPIQTHNGHYNWTAVCVDPLRVAPSVLAQMIATRYSFDEYPVLDEDDYSRREIESFAECFADESRSLSYIFDDSHPLWTRAADIALNDWFGYDEPGYISREHVAKSWEDAATRGLDECECGAADNWRIGCTCELRAYCVVCGSPIDYCQGHGEMGDSDGYDALRAIYGAGEYPYAYDIERIEHGGAKCPATGSGGYIAPLDEDGICEWCDSHHERAFNWVIQRFNPESFEWRPLGE